VSRAAFRLLGTWEVRTERGDVYVPAGRLRTLLTSLALAAGEPVGLDELAEQLWPERLPASARGTLHTYVGRLRKLLGPELVRTHPGGGYVLDVAPDCVDLHRFRALLRRAEETECAEDELALLRQAFTLWRGQPFVEMYSTWLDREVRPRLTEEWFAATCRRIDLELAAGRPERLIAELRDLTSRHPTRESLWLRLITALHLAGRRAEALATYQHVRSVLSEELGIDPSEQLVALQRRVLLDGAAEPDPLVPAPRSPEPSPRQLPHGVCTFTGRQAELAELDRLLASAGSSPVIVSIDGAPGVGKTTLAVQWAHRVAHHYPDAQLYLNLRGYGPGDPIPCATAAETLLRSTGMRADLVPGPVEERFAALRTSLAGRRVLVVLDNARDSDQARPLLPGTTALVIVTSRNQLRGLSVRDGAYRITLDRLPREHSRQMLAAAVGHRRVAEEPEATVRLAELCDHLPLALSIVAERAQRADSLAGVVAALERSRLDGLDAGDNDPHTDLRAALSWSYRTLCAPAAAMFRLLGLHPGDGIDLHAAAALAGVPVPNARAGMDQLVAAHLVEQHRPRRYELADLIRLYARELAYHHVSDVDRLHAVRRLLDWYLHAAASADRRLTPTRSHEFVEPYRPRVPPPAFATAVEARAWFDQEYRGLRAIATWAAANGWPDHAWRIALAMRTYVEGRSSPAARLLRS
jgi:DNA-binding SARP family transcriptional activator